MQIAINSITVINRQRTDYGNIEELAKSLRENGQLQPILVVPIPDSPEQWLLVAGGRRLAAAKQLGWTHVEAFVRDDLSGDETARQVSELEEDIRRKDRTWQEKCLALATLHGLKTRQNAQEGRNWSYRLLADLTGMGLTNLSYMLALAKELKREPDGPVAKASNFMEAYKRMLEATEKTVAAELERRRQATLKAAMLTAPAAPGNVQESNITAEPTAEVEVMLCGIEGDLLPASALAIKLIVGHNARLQDTKYLLELLADGGTAVLWYDGEAEPHFELVLTEQPWPLIWNRVLAKEPSEFAFAPNYSRGFVVHKKPLHEHATKLSSTITAVTEDGRLPLAVIDYSLRQFANDGDHVLLLGDIEPALVAECGLTPVWYEPDAEKFGRKMTALKQHYMQRIEHVRFI